jgi:lysophospholipase L1-like esterase
LEVLEDRCLPSVTTTVPAVSDIPPIVAVPDILSAMLQKGNPTVVFLGDSISWQYIWGTGAAVWSAYMAPLGMDNYGVSGQTTQSLLYQLSLGQLTGINPVEVVLDIGGNNLLQGNSPQDTAAGVLADVAAIHQSLPQTQVLVLGILPGFQNPTDSYRALAAQTNQLVSQMLAGDPHASFLDLGSIFLQPDGTISDSMMFDYLHPTALGYLNLTNALLPVIEQTLIPAFSSTLVLPSLSFNLNSLLPVGNSANTPPSSTVPVSPS